VVLLFEVGSDLVEAWTDRHARQQVLEPAATRGGALVEHDAAAARFLRAEIAAPRIGEHEGAEGRPARGDVVEGALMVGVREVGALGRDHEDETALAVTLLQPA
jgi:hypothetical protein